ncbi:type I phosphodiesterase / nucleotide pyrophosphatase [Campylobacter iguaniorum]|uniref:Type I phosphodiesterase / nucleotide pyrophosphatase n=1 Tax=Campylobacter iguaniorum TaxID=1244531 RepID=A0A076FAJ5_9BACT|nr:alkaline phosphatase family protein [Campylobacter iguaniorum]AII14986.1 type I phosphodiesterase / nucleotide pyrophosphatase [Campylobacter iguaniorum]ALV24814.1 type I phosphodiesterase / nucleotide pyrophosphatase [Campylobacter iguaniorum]
MSKVVLVILDGLEYSVAKECMGGLGALCDENIGKVYKIKCELPSISRPLYECILTGVKPAISGILNNYSKPFSSSKSIFEYAKSAGLKAGAAAYYWVSELYNKTVFDRVKDRIIINEQDLNIPYGVFYYEDDYNDSHLFSDGECLRVKFDLDFTLFHSMNIDDIGHKFGHNSKEYRNAARGVDIILSSLVLKWLEEGISVIITSDHGMNDDMTHGGNLDIERDVAFFVFGDKFSLSKAKVEQSEICGLVCELLGVKQGKNFNKELLK